VLLAVDLHLAYLPAAWLAQHAARRIAARRGR
jgi:hypothetical protein